jgi:hypothetical protein
MLILRGGKTKETAYRQGLNSTHNNSAYIKYAVKSVQM